MIRTFLMGLLMSLPIWGLSVGAADKGNLRVALVQASLAWGDVDANLTRFAGRVAACEGADVIVFPELFVSGCEMRKRDAGEAIDQKERVADRFVEVRDSMILWARRSGALVVGSTIYRSEGKYYNRLLAAYPDGECLYYDKHNCFKRGSFSPGDRRVILSYKGWRLATFICYDLRFPEWSRNDGAYDAALYIANWPEPRHEDWERLLCERAMENAAWIVGVNCAGSDPAGLIYRGGSRLVSPSGEVVGRCPDHQEAIRIVMIGD